MNKRSAEANPETIPSRMPELAPVRHASSRPESATASQHLMAALAILALLALCLIMMGLIAGVAEIANVVR